MEENVQMSSLNLGNGFMISDNYGYYRADAFQPTYYYSANYFGAPISEAVEPVKKSTKTHRHPLTAIFV